jgi:hypothetical protein
MALSITCAESRSDTLQELVLMRSVLPTTDRLNWMNMF